MLNIKLDKTNSIAIHFVNAKVKRFSFDEFELSVKWISEK